MKKIVLVVFLLVFIIIATGCSNGSPWLWTGSSDDGENGSAAVEEFPDEPDESAPNPTPDDDIVPDADNGSDDEINEDDAYIDKFRDERLIGIWTEDLGDTGDFFDVDLSIWESTYEFREDGMSFITSGGSTNVTFPYIWYVEDDILYMRSFTQRTGSPRNYTPDNDRIIEVTWISDDNISIHNQRSGSVLVLYRVVE